MIVDGSGGGGVSEISGHTVLMVCGEGRQRSRVWHQPVEWSVGTGADPENIYE
jgi:hypothetical protein